MKFKIRKSYTSSWYLPKKRLNIKIKDGLWENFDLEFDIKWYTDPKSHDSYSQYDRFVKRHYPNFTVSRRISEFEHKNKKQTKKQKTTSRQIAWNEST